MVKDWMEYLGKVRYGDGWIEGFLPKQVEEEGRLLKFQESKSLPEIREVEEALISSLEEPVGEIKPLSRLIEECYRDSVSIIVDDYTRPNIHTKILLPILLRYLKSKGIKGRDIRIVVASGTHRPPRPQEFKDILGEVVCKTFQNNVFVHNCRSNLIRIGGMEDGVPIEMNETIVNSDLVIPLADATYHYFSGVSGAPKQICPGISGERIITAEHLKMFGEVGFAENVAPGVLDGNPVYEYKKKIVKAFLDALEEKNSSIYAITCILNTRSEMVYLRGGDIFSLHRGAKEVLDKIYIAKMERRVDVVIANAGTYGINLFQTGKAYHNAQYALKPRGKIMVLSPCYEGLGNMAFRDLMEVAMKTFREMDRELAEADEEDRDRIKKEYLDKAIITVMKAVKTDFKIGRQKAVDLLSVLKYAGWGNLNIIQENLSESDLQIIPINNVNGSGSPKEKLKNWVKHLEEMGNPTYCILDDPDILIKV